MNQFTIRELHIRVSTLETQHEYSMSDMGGEKGLSDAEMFFIFLRVNMIYRLIFTRGLTVSPAEIQPCNRLISMIPNHSTPSSAYRPTLWC
jgi:hypothetical protein